jgi:hypothetical protein
MKKDVAKKWTEALRSGKYAQGRGSLCQYAENDRSFCCLGVLCDLYAPECPEAGWSPKQHASTGIPFYGNLAHVAYCRSDACEVEVLPQCVQDWAGVKTNKGQRFTTAEQVVQLTKSAVDAQRNPHEEVPLALTELNDMGVSFDKIADFIDEHWEQL